MTYPQQDLAIVQATWRASSAAIVGNLDLRSYARRVVSMAVQGPTNTTLRIYRGSILASVFLLNTVYPADDRFYDSFSGGAVMLIRPGENLTFAWTGGAAGDGTNGTVATASATVYTEIGG